MTNLAQKLYPPDYRNLVVNPSGEATYAATWFGSNGQVEIGVAVTTPAVGSGHIQYTVTRNSSSGYWASPFGPQDSVHHGAFETSESRTIYLRTSVRAPQHVWVKLQAEHLVWSGDGTFSSVIIQDLGSPLEIVSDDGWHQLEVFEEIDDDAFGSTHWRLQVSVFGSDPDGDPDVGISPPSVGSVLWIDKTYVTDSGADATGHPYIDGAQAGCLWEGDPNISTSRTATIITDEPLPPDVDETPDNDADSADTTDVAGGTLVDEADIPPTAPPPTAPTPSQPDDVIDVVVPLSSAGKIIADRSGAPGSLCMNTDIQLDDLYFNTVDAAGVTWLISDVENWWTLPEPEIIDIPRGALDGSYESNGRYQSRIINITGSFFPQHRDQIRYARDRLIRAANACRGGKWFMTHEYDRTLGSMVWLSGTPLISTINASGRTDFTIGFKAPDPVKYGIKNGIPPGWESLDVLSKPGVAPGRNYPRTYPWAYPEAIFGSTDAIAVNEGNWPVFPIFRLFGPTYGPVNIVNRTTEVSMRVVQRLYPNEVLEIDCARRLVTMNETPNQRFYLELNVDWLELQPGANRLYFLQEEESADRAKLTVQWRSGWIG